MNIKQKIALIVGVLLLVAMGLVPPWSHTFDYGTIHTVKPAGYGLIFSPPAPQQAADLDLAPEFQTYFGIKTDISRLSIQWMIVIFITAGLIILLHDWKRRKRMDAPSFDVGDEMVVQDEEFAGSSHASANVGAPVASEDDL